MSITQRKLLKNILLGQCPNFGFFIFLRDLFTGGVLSDQAEADEDTSLKNRALMAIGTGLTTPF